MSTSHGTGQPLFLKCSKCRSSLRFQHTSRTGMNLVATGKTKKLHGYAASNGGARVMSYQAQYRCLDCGHTGWSRHTAMGRLLDKWRREQTEGTP